MVAGAGRVELRFSPVRGERSYTYEYAAFAPLILTGTAQALMLGETIDPNTSAPYVLMGYQNKRAFRHLIR